MNLATWSVQTFVPRIPSRKCSGCTEILFPGYIFALGDANMFRKLFFVRGVAHVVSFGGRPALVGDDLIQAIRDRTRNKPESGSPAAFKRGDAVMIRSGMFRDLVGIFDRETSDHERVQILLNTLAYSARAEFPRSHVSALDSIAMRKSA